MLQCHQTEQWCDQAPIHQDCIKHKKYIALSVTFAERAKQENSSVDEIAKHMILKNLHTYYSNNLLVTIAILPFNL